MGRQAAIQSQVIGFLKPGFEQTDMNGNVVLVELSYDDFEKVRLGFACANCLSEFNTYTIKCPTCGNIRDLAKDLAEAPKLWQEAHAERNRDEMPDRPRIHNPFEDQYAQILNDPDIEHIPLSKLGKSKWGRS